MPGELTEWRPFADFADLRRRLDQAFRDLGDGERGWTPTMDLVREEDRLVLRADLPGIKPDEVKVEVDEDVLTISGEHREEKEEKEKGKYLRRERSYGSFYRSMSLPAGVDPEAIEATTEDGVLEVVIPLPKAEERKPVTIKPKAKAA